jgi:uncharacterized protein (DUF2384 family)
MRLTWDRRPRFIPARRSEVQGRNACGGATVEYQDVIELLGGRAAVGRGVKTLADLDTAVNAGLPRSALDHVLEMAAPLAERAKLRNRVIPRAGCQRSRRLSAAYSATTERLARITAMARWVWEDDSHIIEAGQARAIAGLPIVSVQSRITVMTCRPTPLRPLRVQPSWDPSRRKCKVESPVNISTLIGACSLSLSNPPSKCSWAAMV